MKVGLACILFSFIALSVGSTLSESLTYDELFYLEESRQIVNTRTFRDPYNPPLTPLLARIPTIFGFESPSASRFVSVGLGVLLILVVYHVGGLAAAALLAFEPTILAHSHYVTNDIAVTLFIFLAAISWMRYMKRASMRHAVLLGLSVGYALSSKVTSLVFLPIALGSVWFGRRIKRWRRLAGSAVVALVVLWASYLFTWDVVIGERDDTGRVSTRLVTYARQHNLPVIEPAVTFFREQPLPLGTYAATMKNNLLRFGHPAMVFFDGELYERSRWYFIIMNVLRKMPIPFLILILVGMWRAPRFAAIGVGIVAIASVVGMVPLIRYVLPAMPFLVLVGGSGIRVVGEIRGIWGKVILFALLLWYIGGTVVQYPHFISYANELVGPRERRFEMLIDSNLDWGQALPDLARYVKQENPAKVRFSYFGRDDAALYGLPSAQPYGGWRFEDICAIHDVVRSSQSTREMTIISISNWYYCGYSRHREYLKEHIRDVVADVFFVF